MKLLAFCSLIVFIATGCISLNNGIVTDSLMDDEKPSYRTYRITANEELSPEVAKTIEAAIEARMNALGLQKGTERTDLSILYKVYEDNFTTVALSPMSFDRAIFFPPDNLQKIKVEGSCIYISFFAKDDQQVVWRGLSSGHSLDPRILRAKTYEIMDQLDLQTETSVPFSTD